MRPSVFRRGRAIVGLCVARGVIVVAVVLDVRDGLHREGCGAVVASWDQECPTSSVHGIGRIHVLGELLVAREPFLEKLVAFILLSMACFADTSAELSLSAESCSISLPKAEMPVYFN